MQATRAAAPFLVVLSIAVAFTGLAPPQALAFNPAETSVGPLRLRVEAPATVDDRGTPIRARLVVENRGASQLEVTVRARGIDPWRLEPVGAVALDVAAGKSRTVDLTATATANTPPCHYPLHVEARFEVDGKTLTAKCVHIFEARFPALPPARRALRWEPIDLIAGGAVALWRTPLRRTVVRVFGESPRTLPVAWSGSDERTRTHVGRGVQTLGGQRRETLSMHPPWYEGRAGTVVAEVPLRLPAGSVRLAFATAIRQHHADRGEPPSDGVTFRVRVAPFDAPAGELGKTLFERHSDSKVWQDATVDLSAHAGSTVRLQLESHPGPKRDTTCDQCFWAEPTVLAGEAPRPAPFPPPVVPLGAEPAGAPPRFEASIEVGGERFSVRCWPGRRGLLDAAVELASGERRALFRGFEVTVGGEALSDRRSTVTLVEVSEETAVGGLRLRHRFRGAEGTFDLIGELSTTRGALRARFALENAPRPQPWHVVRIDAIQLGEWSEPIERVYAGAGNVIDKPAAFDLHFDGHRMSTSFVGAELAGGLAIVEGTNVPSERLVVDSSARRCSLRAPDEQTRIVIPALSVWDAVRVWRDECGRRAGDGVARLAGRFVFDLWGGHYGPSGDALQRAFRYGLTDSVVVWHNWQRWGYDYRLPEIWPPNPRFGTLAEFQRLAKLCREHDVLFAPHDNYIDVYPDAPEFSLDNVAFHADGRPVRAWFNRGRDAQSYRWRPDRVRTPLERNVRLIQKGCDATAYFIDVWSSIGPHEWWTRDGRFGTRVEARQIWGEAFAWIRDVLDGAPQISESGHDQLIGWLDGAQTNHLRVDKRPAGYYAWAVWPIECADAERVPWFDAAYHDRFILHGAGYEPRYAAGLDRKQHGMYSDDYIATEVLTGHPAMVSRPFGRDVVRKYWLLHDLMRALALRTIDRVEFADDDLHRQHVVWSGDANVWVNRGKSDWTIAGHVLPPFGFFARVPTSDGVVEAAIERQEERVVTWSRSPHAIYVNARRSRNESAGVVSAGGVSTTGACRLQADGEALVVTPLPEEPELEVRWRANALPWRVAPGLQAVILAEDGSRQGRTTVRRSAAGFSLTCSAGEFAVRTDAE